MSATTTGYPTGHPRDTVEGFADGTSEFIDTLGLHQVDLPGRTLGGVVAQHVTQRHPTSPAGWSCPPATRAAPFRAATRRRTGSHHPERARGTDDVTVGDAGPDGRVALDALLDRPAEPEDAFPEAFSREWGWDPDDESFPIYRDLDFAASRSVTPRPGVAAFAVPTADRDGVCLFLTHAPPEWFPEIDSVIPVRCADAATFNRDGITLRTCGPADVWVTMALVPVGLDPTDVEPYGTLHPSRAAVLLDGDGPDEPVELAYAPGRTVRLHGAPFGTQPEDGSVPCPIP
jgi:hypothetical protein